MEHIKIIADLTAAPIIEMTAFGRN